LERREERLMRVGVDHRELLERIFEALDEDRSGTMEKEELIKALLCMGLSHDIQFARRIIKVFIDMHIQSKEKSLKKKTYRVRDEEGRITN
jgi:Ca2+-binding EF-hand superfamily protein